MCSQVSLVVLKEIHHYIIAVHHEKSQRLSFNYIINKINKWNTLSVQLPQLISIYPLKKFIKQISINRGYERGWFGAGRIAEDDACLNEIESFVCKVCEAMPTGDYKGPINSLSYHVKTNNMMNHCN